MTKRLFAIIFALISTTFASAQEYSLHWISSPSVDSTSQIWFRKQIVHSKKIKQAFVCIATTGYADLYINARNASRNYLQPYRELYSSYPVSQTYEITRFSNRDTTTIAVWYSPAYPHINPHQISATYYGTYEDGTRFSYITDESWLCRPASSHLNAYGLETTDGRIERNLWKSNHIDDIALWTCSTKQPISSAEHPRSTNHTTNIIGEIIDYRYFDTDKDTTTYDFGNGFIGFVRLTLRGAKKGERIIANGMEYICSGKLDEQAYCRFTTMPVRKLTIYGDRGFRTDHIVNVEGINIATVTNCKNLQTAN